MEKRKQPFGYCMDGGQIVVHPQEAEVVQYVFRQYISGASFSLITNALNIRAVPYDQEKPWNKNMVARILADRRYTGEHGYPEIIDQKAMEAAMRIRSCKQVPIKKNAAQKMIRQLSGQSATEAMEMQVLDLLNSLCGRPERLQAQSLQTDGRSYVALKERLENIMTIQPIDEETARDLIYKLASAQYDMIGATEYETMRLKWIFAKAKPMQALNSELLKTSVTAINVNECGTVSLKLKNNQIVSR